MPCGNQRKTYSAPTIVISHYSPLRLMVAINGAIKMLRGQRQKWFDGIPLSIHELLVTLTFWASIVGLIKAFFIEV
jgi:hypothetical protein